MQFSKRGFGGMAGGVGWPFLKGRLLVCILTYPSFFSSSLAESRVFHLIPMVAEAAALVLLQAQCMGFIHQSEIT